jgi:type IV secretory pathway VirB2 component (pilin)
MNDLMTLNYFKNKDFRVNSVAFAACMLLAGAFLLAFAPHVFAAATTSSGAGSTLWTGITTFFGGGFVKVIVLGVIFFGIFEVATGKHVLMGLLVIVVGALMFYLPTLVNDLPGVFGAVI